MLQGEGDSVGRREIKRERVQGVRIINSRYKTGGD